MGTIRGVTIILTVGQVARLADTFNALGLAAAIGGVADAVLKGTKAGRSKETRTRLKIDIYGVAVGLALLGLSVVLS